MTESPHHTPNRKLRREALKALPKTGDELHGLVEIDLRFLPGNMNVTECPERAWRGAQLSVQQYVASSATLPIIARLSVRRHDGARLREHWRTLFRISQLVFPGHEALEVYPTPERLIDDAPMWHVWILEKGSSIGIAFQ